MIVACECKEAMGLPHLHDCDMGPWVDTWSYDASGDRFFEVRHRAGAGEGVYYGVSVPSQFKINVNWKAVAAEMMKLSAVEDL
jgi:hypothetical protein